MKTKIGILYGMENPAWFQYKKIGRTTQHIKKRISNMQTSLIENINVIYTTDILLDTYFYEFLLKKILKDYRLKTNKEMFDVDIGDIKLIFDFFNKLNLVFNSEKKLHFYIENQYPEYLKKRKSIKTSISSSSSSSSSSIDTHSSNNNIPTQKNHTKNKKNKKGLFVDTSCL